MFKYLARPKLTLVIKVFAALLFIILILLNKDQIVRMALTSQYLSKGVKRVLSKLEKKACMVIIVHGSVGTTVSLLDIANVGADKVENTAYKATIAKMRSYPLFWKEQAMADRGLVSMAKALKPDLSLADPRPVFGAHKIFQTFFKIAALAGDGRQLLPYTYGWSGLLSQRRRRKEAIRFYNQLFQAIGDLEEKGIIDPDILIVTHSHGGNVALNLAGVDCALKGWPEKRLGELDLARAFDELIDQLPVYAKASVTERKKFDYRPIGKIGQKIALVALGLPIQSETANLATGELFKKVVNVYSNEDSIQMMDFFSSKDNPAGRKLLPSIDFDNRDKISQVCATVGAAVAKGRKKVDDSGISWWKAMLGMKDTSRVSQDPTHRELWSMCFDNIDGHPFKPLPLIVFVPVLLRFLDHTSTNDFRFDLREESGRLVISAIDGHEALDKFYIDGSVMRTLRDLKNYDYTPEERARISEFSNGMVAYWRKIQNAS